MQFKLPLQDPPNTEDVNNMWTKDCVSDDISEKANVGMGVQSVMEKEISKFYFKVDHELLLISQAGQFSVLPLESGGVLHILFSIACLH